jgi:hypothetical protein
MALMGHLVFKKQQNLTKNKEISTTWVVKRFYFAAVTVYLTQNFLYIIERTKE